MAGFKNGESGIKIRNGKRIEVAGCWLTFDREVCVHVDPAPGHEMPELRILDRGGLAILPHDRLTKPV